MQRSSAVIQSLELVVQQSGVDHFFQILISPEPVLRALGPNSLLAVELL